ncbi:MAG: hypothetical protein KDD47_28900, partial [Acidobacteria bacterium]|nr:hypothetical protein [Acidobacteriota bacterium]
MAVVLTAWAGSLQATTLIRMGLGELVTANETIVLGEVVDAESYWNAEGTFILTDVTFKAVETIRGSAPGSLTVTLMGGTVGELTSLIIGGPELIPGRSYLLFLNPETLPGAEGVTTVRDLCQGAYDLRTDESGALRAV